MKSKVVYVGDGCKPLKADVKGLGVLIDVGTCTYYQKALHAEDAKAAFILLSNPLGTPGFPGS